MLLALTAAAGARAAGIRTLSPRGSGPLRTFSVPKRAPHQWVRLSMPFAHQVPVFAELQNQQGQVLGYIFREGLKPNMDGQPIDPGDTSAWIDLASHLGQDATTTFRLRGLFDRGRQVSGWGVKVQVYRGSGQPPAPERTHLRINWPLGLSHHAEKHVRPPVVPCVDWIDAAAIMQPWCGEFSEAMILNRDEWIPKLRDDLGISAIIFIPPRGDIEPNYPMEVYKQTVADYHAGGLKVLMYWSIMHVGHHDAWHQVAKEHPEWAQRDADGNPITTYGDLWLCPSTGALPYCIDLGVRLMLEMGADGTMLDNNGFGRTAKGGVTCYCESCRRKFADWLTKPVPAEAGGPLPGNPLYPYWREWRYKVWADADAAFRLAVRRAKPGAILSANTQYYGNWTLAAHGQYRDLDLIFSESRNLLGPAMSMKLMYARSLSRGKPVWNYLGTWVPGDRSRLLPAGSIEDAICTCFAKAASPWLVGYGYPPQKGRPHWAEAHYGSPKPNGQVAYDTEVASSGTTSARLTLGEVGRISLYQKPFLSVRPGQAYAFSCAVRESNVGPGKARVRLTFVNDRHKAPEGTPYTFFVDGAGGTHDWLRLRRDGIVAPQGATLLNVEAFLWGAKGTTWFDELSLTEEGGTANLLANPGFETSQAPGQSAALAAAKKCLTFSKRHRQYLKGLTPYTNVAVLASRRSTDYGGRPRLPFAVVRSLLACNVGFSMVGDDDLTVPALGRYDVLLMASANCLSDEAVRAVTQWTRAGGGLIFTGDTGTRDELGHVRGADRMFSALGLPAQKLKSVQQLSQGRTLWVEGDAERLLAHSDRDFCQHLAQTVVDLGGGLVHVSASSPRLEVSAFCQPSHKRLVITLDNQGNNPEPAGVRLHVPIPKGWGSTVTFLDLDGEGHVTVKPVPHGLKVDIPPVRRLALLVIE